MKWILILVLLFPMVAVASENCAVQFSGKCKDVCASNEYAAEGAFIDCGDKEECCVITESHKDKDERTGSEGKEQDRKLKGGE